MASPLEIARQRQADCWLIGVDSSQFNFLLDQRQSELAAYQRQGNLPRILLAETNPVGFLAGLLAACMAECPVFLGTPNWQSNEWQQVLPLVQPNLVWGSLPNVDVAIAPPAPNHGQKMAQPGWIMIPTGGSSGQIRFAIHTWQTLQASVLACQQYFQTTQINSVCVLPLYHVSGLMQGLRSFTTGGQLMIAPFSELVDRLAGSTEPVWGKLPLEEFWLSLVPTQLQRLLQIPAAIARLSKFKAVLLGGAPAGDDLLAQARQHQIRLAPTYGMTETASQVVTLKPEAFLAGNANYGQALPHAKIQILSPEGAKLGLNLVGQICIQAASLALGYYPQVFAEPALLTDDLGFIDEQGNLQIVGRNSQKIITGGENVFPAEVEAAIMATGLVQDVCVIGLPDQVWGEVVTAIYVPVEQAFPRGCTNRFAVPEGIASTLQQALHHRLSKFKQPKRWLAIAQIPRNQQGKVNYPQLKIWAENQANQEQDSILESGL